MMHRSGTRPIFFLMSLLGWASAIIVGCSQPINGRAPTPTPLTVQDIIRRSQAAALQDTSGTIEEMVTGTEPKSGQNLTLDLKGTQSITTQPARADIVLGTSLLGITFSTESITDGNFDYVMVTTSSNSSSTTPLWQKCPANSPQAGTGNPNLNLTDLQHPILIGMEKVGTFQTYHIQGTLAPTTPTPGTTAGAEDLWIRIDNFYIAKLVVNATLPSYSILTQVAVQATIVFTKWNSGLTIVIPAPNQTTTCMLGTGQIG